MKKLLCGIIAVIAIFAITACGTSGESESAVIKCEVEGITIQYEMDAVNDIIQTLKQTSTLDKAAFTVADVDAFEISFADYKAIYGAIEGVTYETESTDTELIEIITMDVSNKETLQTLADQGLLPVNGNTKRLSMSNTIEELTSQGWVLVE